MNRKVMGWILIIAGVLGGLLSGLKISDDMTPRSVFGGYYSYEPPFTGYEIMMIAFVMLSVIVFSSDCIC